MAPSMLVIIISLLAIASAVNPREIYGIAIVDKVIQWLDETLNVDRDGPLYIESSEHSHLDTSDILHFSIDIQDEFTPQSLHCSDEDGELGSEAMKDVLHMVCEDDKGYGDTSMQRGFDDTSLDMEHLSIPQSLDCFDTNGEMGSQPVRGALQRWHDDDEGDIDPLVQRGVNFKSLIESDTAPTLQASSSQACDTTLPIHRDDKGITSSCEFMNRCEDTTPNDVIPADVRQTNLSTDSAVPIWLCQCGHTIRIKTMKDLIVHVRSNRHRPFGLRLENDVLKWFFKSGSCLCGWTCTTHSTTRLRHLFSQRHLILLQHVLGLDPVRVVSALKTPCEYYEMVHSTASRMLAMYTNAATALDLSAVISIMTPPQLRVRGRFIQGTCGGATVPQTASSSNELYICTQELLDKEKLKYGAINSVKNKDRQSARRNMQANAISHWKCGCGKVVSRPWQSAISLHYCTDKHINWARSGDETRLADEDRVVLDRFYTGGHQCICQCRTEHKRKLTKRVHLKSLLHLQMMAHALGCHDPVNNSLCACPSGACTGGKGHELQNGREFSLNYVKLVKTVTEKLIGYTRFGFRSQDRNVIESVMIPEGLSEFAKAKEELMYHRS